jgi:hypothetical protein
VHPTARSAPDSRSGTRTAPAEWHRSHSVRAPTRCAAVVIATMSAMAPERYATWDRHTSATSSSRAAATCAGSIPASMSVSTPAARGRGRRRGPPGRIGRWEVVVVDDRAAPRAGIQRRGRELVHVDAGRVRQDHFAGRDVEYRRGQNVAGGPGQVDPHVPAPDQVVAPFAVDGVAEPLAGGQRQAPERVTVIIDPEYRKRPEMSDRVLGFGIVAREAHVSDGRPPATGWSWSPANVKPVF